MDTNYVQNEQENVQINVIQNKKPDNLCRAGCIIAIVISSLALIGFSIGGLIDFLRYLVLLLKYSYKI